MAEENIEQKDTIIAHKENLVSVMQEESALLDKILEQQTVLHDCVKDKDWEMLNRNIENLQPLSDQFVELEEKRTALSANIDMASDVEISPVLSEVRGKLQKSKVLLMKRNTPELPISLHMAFPVRLTVKRYV